MSISIIGAGGNKLSIIIEDKILNKINDIEIEYTLLKEKYITKCSTMIINKICYSHFVKKLIKLFNSESIDIIHFANFINKANNKLDLIFHIKQQIDRFNINTKLYDIVTKINKKLQIQNESNSLDKSIRFILKKTQIDKRKTEEINKYLTNLKIIEESIAKIKLKRVPSIKIRKMNSIIFINDILAGLDNLININNISKKYIIDIDDNINSITNILTSVYLSIK